MRRAGYDDCPTLCANPSTGALALQSVQGVWSALRSHDLTGRGAYYTQKRTPHRVGAAETAFGGHRLHAHRRRFEQATCHLDAHTLDEARWRRALLAAKDARKLARAHVHVVGHTLDADVLGEVLEDPIL